MPPLSENQKRAIEKTQGPCVILAGAGTGKTHTIVEKIKHLIQKNVYPSKKIVCITFSNEAANNLLTRVRTQLDLPVEKEPLIRTFHALSSLILKKYGDRIGLNKEFEILDPDEAKVLLHTNLKIATPYCHRYIASLHTAKDLGITPEKVKEYLKQKNPHDENLHKKCEDLQLELHTGYNSLPKEKKAQLKKELQKIKELYELDKFLKVWITYEKLKEKKNLQDYSDLNNNALAILQRFPELTKEFSYVIVDEFQDTNKIQLDMIFALAPHKNITVVGDLNQSIYQFRGAYEENINLFRKHFGVESKDIFNLDRSYRSPNRVLALAHELIVHNYQDPSNCFEVKNANARDGQEIEIFELKNAQEEARKITEIIENEKEEGKAYEDICVLYRAHQHGRIIKRALEIKKIPFVAIGKSSLLKQKSIKQIVNYLSLVNKILKKDRGIQEWWTLVFQSNLHKDDLVKVTEFIKEKKEEENCNAKILSNIDKLALSEEGAMKIRSITERVKLLIPLNGMPLIDFLEAAYPILGVLTDGADKKETMLNLNRFHELAKRHAKQHYPELDSFLNHLAAMEELGIEIEAAEIEQSGVRLMTSHATKGLEFKTVILTNLADKRFPMENGSRTSLIPLELIIASKNISSAQSIEDAEKRSQLLEERRLCYVSFTRAKEKLFLTYAQEYAQKKTGPSRFLLELKFKENKKTKFTQDLEEKPLAPGEPELQPAQEVNTSDLKAKTFSPSSLLTFRECQKKFEYKYIYNMPEKTTFSMDAAKAGSFVHLVLEQGVSKQFTTLKEFKDLALTLFTEEEWSSIDIADALMLIEIFFERNKTKFSPESRTEQPLKLDIEGLRFIGFADRIDFTPKGIEIIDYKTGKTILTPTERNFQLGYYALAASRLGKVKKLTLDMLRHEKPLEFDLDDSGLAMSENGRMSFDLNEVKEELASTARDILSAYKSGFMPCPVEKNCEFCEEYVY